MSCPLRRFIYFSDPYYGPHAWHGRLSVRGSLGFRAGTAPAGRRAPQLLVDLPPFDQPNGLCFSPDEKLRSTSNDTVLQTLSRVFASRGDGALSTTMLCLWRSFVARAGLPDGRNAGPSRQWSG